MLNMPTVVRFFTMLRGNPDAKEHEILLNS